MIINDFGYLKTFLVFCESKNITEASQRLSLSQPTVTTHIRFLEENQSKPLFEFIGKKKQLTSYGREYYALVKEHLTAMESEYLTLTQAHVNLKDRTISIGARSEILDSLPEMLSIYSRAKFISMSSDEIKSALKQRKIDAGILPNSNGLDHLVRKKLFTDKVYLVRKENKKKYDHKSYLSKKFYQNFNLICYKENFPFFKDLKKVSDLKFCRQEFRFCVDRWSVILQLILKYNGLSFIPERLCPINDPKYHCTEVKELKGQVFYLYYYKDSSKLFKIN